MKKSKIIIPAAAILALSVGASVTGTVAWFTAARTASFTGNNLAVVNAAGDLKVTLSAVTGCSLSADSKSVNLTYLRDASFDGSKVYVADLSQDGTKIIGLSEAALGSYTTAQVKVDDEVLPKNVYKINQWTATFATSSAEKTYLFFNPDQAKSFVSSATGTAINPATNSIYKSLRVMMKCGEKTMVWAPYTTDETIYHVTKATASLDIDATTQPANMVTSYGDSIGVTSNVVKKVSTSEVISERSSSTDAANAIYCLSTDLTKDASKVVTCSLWFEGLDSSCFTSAADVTTAIAETMNNISFYFFAITENSFSDKTVNA
ncbi:MAG: hypothetical protein MR501_01160 [Mollicutes bacterium]|nr:hypothetical protein [Mollicutes bacterium]